MTGGSGYIGGELIRLLLGHPEVQLTAVTSGRLAGRPVDTAHPNLRGLTTLAGRRTHFQDAWLRLHREPGPGDGPAEGITWSSENRFTRPLRSLDLDRRIDYVFVTTRKKDGRGTVHDCRVVLTEREGLGEVAICASDHYGVVVDVELGTDPTAA